MPVMWHPTLRSVAAFAALFWPAQDELYQIYDIDGEGRVVAGGQPVAADSPAGRRLLRDLPDLSTSPPPPARRKEN